jgi:hypothetical protein
MDGYKYSQVMDMALEQRLAFYQSLITAIVREANDAGVVVEVHRISHPPLAMGRHTAQVHVRAARHAYAPSSNGPSHWHETDKRMDGHCLWCGEHKKECRCPPDVFAKLHMQRST